MASKNGLLFGTAGIPLSTWHPTIETGIERVRELGLDCMEVEFVRGVYMSPDSASAVAKVAQKEEVKLSAHAPYFINLNAREPEKVIASRERILQTARITSLFGGHSVVFHAAYYLEDVPSKVYDVVKENVELIIDELRTDLNSIQLRPEVMGKASSFGTIEELLNLSAEVSGVAPTIDFSHWHARTGKANSHPEFMAVLKQMEETLGREGLDNMHIHLSGIEYGPKGEKKHLPLSESDFQYTALLKALKKYNVSGCVICESPNREEDALLLQETYEAL